MMEDMDISPSVTPRLLGNTDDKAKTSDRDVSQSPNSRDGSKSPESNCSICLGKFENKSFTDGCFHTFCFVCLQEWSKVKATCPLCKTAFRSIIHNIKSNEMYDQYYLPPTRNGALRMAANDARFRYRSTLTEERRQHLAHRRNWFLNQVRRRSRHESREAAGYEHRRLVYALGLPNTGPVTRSRFRNITSVFFRSNPACMHRLVPWLRREFEVLFANNTDHAHFMTNLVMSYIPQVDMQSEEFLEYLRPFLYHRTEQFTQELIRFAQSPYDMRGFDSNVCYDMSQVNPREQARLIGQDIPLISLSPDSSSDSSQDQNSSEFSLIESQPSTSGAIGLFNLPESSSEQPSTSNSLLASELFDTHNPEPPAENQNEEADSSTSDDVLFVGCVKPTAQRTPEAIIVLSSDDEQEVVPANSDGRQVRNRKSTRNYERRGDHEYHRRHRDSSSSSYSSSLSRRRSKSRSRERRGYRYRSSSYSDESYSPRRDSRNKPGGKRTQKTRHVEKSSNRYSSRHYRRSRSRDSFLSTDSDASERLYSSRYNSRSKFRYSRGYSRSRSRSRSPLRNYRHRSHHYGNDERCWSSSSNFSKASTKSNSSKSKSYTESVHSRSRRSTSRSDLHKSCDTRTRRKSSSVEFMGAYGKHSRHRRNSNTYRLSDTDSDIEVTHVTPAKKQKHRHKKHKRKHKKDKRSKKKSASPKETAGNVTETLSVQDIDSYPSALPIGENQGSKHPSTPNVSPGSEKECSRNPISASTSPKKTVTMPTTSANTSPSNQNPVAMETDEQEPNVSKFILPLQFNQARGKVLEKGTTQAETTKKTEGEDKKVWTALDLLLQVERKRLKKLEKQDSTLDN